MFAGIDGGGSKTLAVVVDEQGREVGRGLAATANYRVLMGQGYSDREAASMAAAHVAEALARALPSNNMNLTGVFAGLAGVNNPTDVTLMETALAHTGLCQPTNWQVVNDAELILYGLPQGEGVGLVAGTGSIAVGRDRAGQSGRAGGWGYLFGDEGSGYALGRAALQAAAQSADGRGPGTTLLPAILDHWQVSQPADLLEAVYGQSQERHQQIARLAELVLEEAERHDGLAVRLVEQAGCDLSAAANAVYQQLDFKRDAVGLGLGGSLLLHSPALRQAVLKELAWQPSVVVDVTDPAQAAALACRTREVVSR